MSASLYFHFSMFSPFQWLVYLEIYSVLMGLHILDQCLLMVWLWMYVVQAAGGGSIILVVLLEFFFIKWWDGLSKAIFFYFKRLFTGSWLYVWDIMFAFLSRCGSTSDTSDCIIYFFSIELDVEPSVTQHASDRFVNSSSSVIP